MNDDRAMFIGKLAAAVGVKAQTVRYYERLGLLPEPMRNRSGYRLYGEGALKRMRFIKRAQTLGFSLNEIKSILELSRDGKRPCLSVREIAKAKLAEADRMLEDLLAYRQELAERIEQWEEIQDGQSDATVYQLIEMSKAAKGS
ncbi:MAG: heavy metal-responsive transcriptional regulator [Blastocatellia bacterium]|nr:heavy metal-responsive transcriptional regulator [Blastocatellia bacterium]